MSPKVFLQFLIGDVVLMIYSRFYKKLVMIIIMKFSFWFRNAIFFCIPQNKYLQIKISSMNCGNELPIVCMFQRNLDFAPVKIQFDWLQMETDRLHHSYFAFLPFQKISLEFYGNTMYFVSTSDFLIEFLQWNTKSMQIENTLIFILPKKMFWNPVFVWYNLFFYSLFE